MRRSPVPPLCDGLDGPDDPGRERRLDWATPLKRTGAIDVLRCPNCAGPMRVIAFLDEGHTAQKILEHLGLPSRAPPRERRRAQQLLAVALHNRP